MSNIITRFAPSPTGHLHIGNARIALVNWLFAKQHNGKFFLRIDNTDNIRNQNEYELSIKKDLIFLKLQWDKIFYQSNNVQYYNEIKNLLIKNNILYPCFETEAELAENRKNQLSQGSPPIYNRASLNLSTKQIRSYINEGRRPHYRFLIQHIPIVWDDMIRGTIQYHGKKISDPIVIREDGSMTYMMSSVVDDINYNITHIIRGEDHLTNTAIQIQIFQALKAKIPFFAHLSLIKSKEEKISKRLGGFEIMSLREKSGLEAMTINSFFSLLGSSKPIKVYKTLEELLLYFDIKTLSKSSTIYLPSELLNLNQKLLMQLTYTEIKDRLYEINCGNIDNNFWTIIKNNLNSLNDIKEWSHIYSTRQNNQTIDLNFLKEATLLLKNTDNNPDIWNNWIENIILHTKKTKKEVLLLLRIALTSKTKGPKLLDLLNLLGKDEVIKRLQNNNF